MEIEVQEIPKLESQNNVENENTETVSYQIVNENDKIISDLTEKENEKYDAEDNEEDTKTETEEYNRDKIKEVYGLEPKQLKDVKGY